MNTKIFISSCSSELDELKSKISFFLMKHADVCPIFDQANTGDNWFELIQSQISSSDTFILLLEADLKPNALFEAGVALGAGKQIILIAASNAGIPAPLRDFPAVYYDPHLKEPNETASTVCRALDRFTWNASTKSAKSYTSALNNLKTIVVESTHLSEVDPMRFEELVMESLVEIGWNVHSPDLGGGYGFDFAASWPEEDDCILFVECKKLSMQKMVGMEPLLKLANAIRFSDNSRGLLITTAPLTASALGFLDEVKDRLLVLPIEDFVSDPKRVTSFCIGKDRSRRGRK